VLGLIGQPAPHSPHGLDHVLAELAAQVADVELDHEPHTVTNSNPGLRPPI
jgi:hypothetical protein